MTRGRGQNLGLVVDPTGMADPEEAFAAVIARPANARTALAVRDRLRGPEPPAPAAQLEAPPPATDPAPADNDHVARMARRLSQPAFPRRSPRKLRR